MKKKSFLSQLLVLFYDALVQHVQLPVLYLHLRLHPHHRHGLVLWFFSSPSGSHPVSLTASLETTERYREREIVKERTCLVSEHERWISLIFFPGKQWNTREKAEESPSTRTSCFTLFSSVPIYRLVIYRWKGVRERERLEEGKGEGEGEGDVLCGLRMGGGNEWN